MQFVPFIQNDPLLQGNADCPILVLGLGNILLQDEGIGVHVVQQLQRDYQLPPHVEVMDGGTAGMALYEHIVERDHLIVVDAVRTGQAPGTLVRLENEDVPAFFRNKVSPHQMALSDILAALKIAGECPPDIVVIGIEPVRMKTGLEMSAIVSAKLDRLVENTLQCLAQLGVNVQLNFSR